MRYRDAHALQQRLFASGRDDHLLLLEHPHVFTLGRRADPTHVLVDPASVGAELVTADRGGDVTYHGPGQLVGYPIRSVAGKRGGGMADTVAYVTGVEQLLIDALDTLGLPGAGRLPGYPGVWVEPEGPEPRKIAAIGVRLSRGRSMHGFALNVDPDLTYFHHIVPCGLDRPVTSLHAEGVDVTMREVVDVVADAAARRWAPDGRWDRADVVWRQAPTDLSAFSQGLGPGSPVGPAEHGASEHGAPNAGDGIAVAAPSRRRRRRLVEAGVTQSVAITDRKPEWMRARVRLGDDYRRVEHLLRDLDLVTVCEEAGCPNRSECWNDGTATFMLNGERCTRACGFCLVDTRQPLPPSADEPRRVADAVERLGLDYVVLTAVARDDLGDGGAAGFVAAIDEIRARVAGVQVEVLIPDCKGDPDALGAIFAARPDVLNHNLETVPRLQRAVRPSASSARSLAVLAQAKAAGLVTKSGLIVGLGEDDDEVESALADLAAIEVDIVTIGQYLRPTTNHLPVARWWSPEELEGLARLGRELGIVHVEASPFTRSSHHAKESLRAVRDPAGC